MALGDFLDCVCVVAIFGTNVMTEDLFLAVERQDIAITLYCRVVVAYCALSG